jgi:hypothetical protein
MQVITRINYGQSVLISGLAGAVSLAGSGGGLWAIKGGNWQMAAGLINRSDAALHVHEEIDSISYLGEYYELNSTKGNSYKCEVAVVATPLDELNIQFTPSISIPKRKLQHTHATFVRGLLNPVSILSTALYWTFLCALSDFIFFFLNRNVLLCQGIFWPGCCIRNPRTGRHYRGF